MTDKLGTLDTVNAITDILLLSLMILQQITGKSQDEVLEAIRGESKRTDELIAKLR